MQGQGPARDLHAGPELDRGYGPIFRGRECNHMSRPRRRRPKEHRARLPDGSPRWRTARVPLLPGLGRKQGLDNWLKDHSVEEFNDIVGRTRPETRSPTVTDPSTWQDQPIPPRIFVVEPLIPARNVSLLYGDGGLGKSLLALMLAASRALEQPWLGLQTLPGRTLVLSAEDDLDEMHRRLAGITGCHKASLGDLGAMRLVDLVGQDAVIGELARNGRIVATELYQFLIDQIASFDPGLVIVDALADSFSGDENNRTQARQFISMLRRAGTANDCSFVAVAHPSLSGITSGRGTSGSTGWSNSVRSRLYFETVEVDGKEPDPNLKVLRQHKANYSVAGFEIVVRYEHGVYVPVEGGQAQMDQAAKLAMHEHVFMAILRRLFAQGRFVNQVSGISYAPHVFSTEPEAQEKMVSKGQLKAAMIRLFEQKTIRLENFGPPSRGKQRIIESLMSI